MGKTVRYRNKKTKAVATFTQRMRLLEKSDDWERQEEGQRPWPQSQPLERPASSAPKDTWVAYAERQGVDTADLTKEQIIAAVGEDPAG